MIRFWQTAYRGDDNGTSWVHIQKGTGNYYLYQKVTEGYQKQEKILFILLLLFFI